MSRLLFAAFLSAGIVTGLTTAHAQNRQAELIARLKQELGGAFRVNAVQIDGKTLQVVVNDREIVQESYAALVVATCTHLGTEARQFTEVAFGNRFADQGYVFAAPAKCQEILKMAPEPQKAAILADTHEL